MEFFNKNTNYRSQRKYPEHKGNSRKYQKTIQNSLGNFPKSYN